MAQNDYFRSVFPAPWQILGITLKPFSLGHYIKLRALGCAFVADEPAQATLGDLILGLTVCSYSSHPDQSKDPFYVWLNRPAKKSIVATLLGKVPMTPSELDVYRWGKWAKGVDLAPKAKLFADYIAEHTREPMYWRLNEDGGGKSGAHWSHAVISSLIMECGYSQEDAYNVPMSKALQDYFRAAETQGSVRLMTADEMEAMHG